MFTKRTWHQKRILVSHLVHKKLLSFRWEIHFLHKKDQKGLIPVSLTHTFSLPHIFCLTRSPGCHGRRVSRRRRCIPLRSSALWGGECDPNAAPEEREWVWERERERMREKEGEKKGKKSIWEIERGRKREITSCRLEPKWLEIWIMTFASGKSIAVSPTFEIKKVFTAGSCLNMRMTLNRSS